MSNAPESIAVADTSTLHATHEQKLSWVLYDWANSAYGLIVIGVPFADYFISQLLPAQPLLGTAPDGTVRTGLILGGTTLSASAVMGLMTSISMALMALGAPLLGAIADVKGWTRRLLIAHTLVGSLLTISMLFLRNGTWGWAMFLYIASNYCFGMACTFYNAFLPKLVEPHKQGSLSGWGFASGYVGGLLAMLLTLACSPTVGLALAGVWWLIFSVPAFLFLPEFPPQAAHLRGADLLAEGLRRLKNTLGNIRQYRMLFLFLLAFLLYNDGIETVIALSPAFGKEALGMKRQQLYVMFLGIQIVAFLGAVAFGYLADRIGNKVVIVSNLIAWLLAASAVFWVQSAIQFTILGLIIGLFLGGVQASSRALMSLLAPAHIRNEAFGFFSISGKFASILGPLLYAMLATHYNDSRYGIFAVLPFLLAGGVLMVFIREPRT